MPPSFLKCSRRFDFTLFVPISSLSIDVSAMSRLFSFWQCNLCNNESLLQEFQVSRIEKAWHNELDPEFRANRCCCRSKPSLVRAVFAVSGHYVFLGNLSGFVYGVTAGLLRPLLIKSLVEELGSPSKIR